MTDNILNTLEHELLNMKLIRTTNPSDSFEYKQAVARVEELYEQALFTSSKTAAAKLLVKIMKP